MPSLYVTSNATPTIPANNNTGLYNATGNAIPIGNDIDISGNILANGYISAGGNITTSGVFVGNGAGLTGVVAGTANTAVTVTGNAQANITSVGVLTALSVSGNIAGNYILGNGSQLTGMYGNANVAAYLPTNTANISAGTISATGNITGNYLIGNGSQLTGTYSNANVAAFLPTYSGDITAEDITASATIQAAVLQTSGVSGNIVGANYVQANYFVGDGSYLTNINAGNIVGSYGNANVANYLASGNLTSNVITTGNVSGNYFLGNGSQLTGLPATYGNANVATYLASGNLTSNVITTGNVSGSYILGNGSQLTGLPATYGNANVATYLASGNVTSNIITTGNVSGSYILGNGSQLTGMYGNAAVATFLGNLGNTEISTSGNVTTGNLHVTGNLFTDDISSANIIVYGDQVITGNLTVQGNTTTINSNVITTNDKIITVANNQSTGANVDGAGFEAGNPYLAAWLFSNAETAWRTNINIVPDAGSSLNLGSPGNRWTTVYGNTGNFTGNITGNYLIGNGSQLTGMYGNADVSTYLASGTVTSNVNTTGNVSGNYILGNGSQLTGMYGNADVSTYLASGNVISNVITTGNVSGSYILGNGSQLTGLPSGYSNADVATYLASGTVTSNIITTGNVSGNYILGNGSQLTGLPSGYSNADVATYLASGNLTSNIITTGNVSGNYFVGNGSLLTGIASSYGNADVANYLASGNVTSNVITTGNVTGGNVISSGAVSLSGNLIIQGNPRYIQADFTTVVANGGATYFQTSVANSSTAVRSIPNGTNQIATWVVFNNSNISANLQTGALRASNTAISVTSSAIGNVANQLPITMEIQGNTYVSVKPFTGEVNFGGNTILGNTAAAGGVGNIVIGRNIATDIPYAPITVSGVNQSNGRIIMGSGFNGNISPAFDLVNSGRASRFTLTDSYNHGANDIGRAQTIQNYITLTANVSNTASRINGITSSLVVGGANTFATTGSTPHMISSAIFGPQLGGVGNLSALGNVTAAGMAAVGAFPTVNTGSNVGNLYSFVSAPSFNTTSTANTMIGFESTVNAGAVAPTRFFSFHQASNVNAYGYAIPNTVRAASEYYFLRNDDAVAQCQIGSLRSYNEYRYPLATSGTVDISKTNSQVQYLAPTGNVTIGSFLNFNSSLSDGTNTDEQADTVTIIVAQGATPYTVTMPTGNASIKYASGTSTVGSTANSVTMIAITATRIANSTVYLTTISPEFV